MRILVIGSGGREHALVWKLAQSPRVRDIYAAPGNGGTAELAHNLDISPTDIESLIKVACDRGIDLAVIGPESPLALGIVDALEGEGIPTFGPCKEGALIESSKVFARDLMQRYRLPCAQGASFACFKDARDYVQERAAPLVVKADGLAAGKGVIVAASKEQAIEALDDIMEKRIFGDAGNQVLIEECLVGREASLLAFTDGEAVIPMIPACDYKRAFDDDQGPNTGGMGSYSPSEFFTPELTEQVMETIIKPAVRAMALEGKPYKGVLYAGLMITEEGPKVLEFNARFGDPETQVILPLLRTDLVDIMEAVVEGTLSRIDIEWSAESCVGVVMASAGYPGSYETGFHISGLGEVDEGILIFHAGTTRDQGTGNLITSGGRVLTVAATGKTLADARAKVYRNLPRIGFEGCYYRRDIACLPARQVAI
ncbi:phosphoribosylamine--glycine ligase [Dehalococcoidia bacterium]|nr:phosphoribosylamine--glycine ligase [Dehalococcoidia bacterium]